MTSHLRRLLVGEGPAAEAVSSDVIPCYFVINGSSTPVLVRKSASINQVFTELAKLTGRPVVDLRWQNTLLPQFVLHAWVHQDIDVFRAASYTSPLVPIMG